MNATGRIFVAMLVSILGGPASAATQSLAPLSLLTVPAAALPAECALYQPPPTPSTVSGGPARTIRLASSLTFPTNPWSGRDRAIVTAVRKAIDGAPRLPDGPPLDAHEAAAFELKLADHVVEAYHAAYGPNESRSDVYAVTFDDVTLAATDPLSAATASSRRFRSRLVKGASVIVVSAPVASECVRAIDAYVRSLK